MRTAEQIIRSQRLCGWFFVFLGVVSLVLAPISFWQGHWIEGSILLFGVLFCIIVGRLAIIGALRRPGFGGGPYEFDIGMPIPVKPSPTHHLQTAKDLPPSEKTNILPKD
jgi:hypothetical protein